MLREEVVNVVHEGRFRVIAVETIDQGIEVLTGVKAGRRGSDGLFERGSVNELVENQLRAFAKARKAFARTSENVDSTGNT